MLNFIPPMNVTTAFHHTAWLVCVSLPLLSVTCRSAEQTVSDWQGYRKTSFTLQDHPAFIVEPRIAAPGRPWVWRTSFPDFHAEVDLELLHNGWHVAYIDCVDMLGSDPALDLMDQFYDELRAKWELGPKPALEGVSRGGLHAYRYAARHPQRIACIYADTPVMDLKSWPGKQPQAAQQWKDALKYYGFPSDAEALAYKGNPLDLLSAIARAKLPLRHVISLNDKIVPPEENTLEASRRLNALGWEMDVVRVQAGTPESGGHHFPLPEVFASARFIMAHTTVLPKNSEYYVLRDGLSRCRARFESQKAGRVAFLGGSITHNPGWRDEVMRYLRLRFPETRLDFICTGVPSLGSVPNSFRLERDVLSKGPIDLLFVEAAVNDTTNESNTNRMLRGMEGIVRHARLSNPLTDIVQMHFVMPEHITDYSQGRVPESVAQHERVAAVYRNPSVDLSREVTDRINAGEFTWAGDFKDLHPSPYGQQVYANSITRLLDAAFAQPAKPVVPHSVPPRPLDDQSYWRGRLGALSEVRISSGFALEPNWNPTDNKGTREGFVNVPVLVGTQPGAEFSFTFEGTGAGLFITSGPDAGIIEFSTDGGPFSKLDTFTQWSSSLHLPWALMLNDSLRPGRHDIRVRIAAEHNGKSSGTALRVVHLLLN